jgi:hypothetical protein
MTQPLTDAEIDHIMEAAWALHPSQRGAFEQTVITELQRLPPAARPWHATPHYRPRTAHLSPQ